MYIIITPHGEKRRREDNLKRARASIAGTDLVIKYTKKARKIYMEKKANEKV